MDDQGKNHGVSNFMERVKVYHLNDDGKWNDWGTGHVSVNFLERSEDLGLFVVDEEDNDTLLVHRISSEDIYRKQEDTIISWRDPDLSTELALSFQEPTSCSYIWDQICSVQRREHFSTLSDLEGGPRPAREILETAGTPQANGETVHGVNSELREFPSVELSTLPLILKIVVDGGIANQMHLADLILQDQDFFPKLVDLFRICEDMENIDGLHMIFKLVKGIILLNSPQIIDKIFGDELIMDIIGSLEYDPELPQVQQHRTFLKEHVVFKEAIPIKDPFALSKIHQTYRVGYIKDVILSRVFDDAKVGSLDSIIHENNAIVVSLLKDDKTFIQELFSKIRSSTTSAESKKKLVLFLEEFCSLSKSLQQLQQLRLFRELVNEGIFDIITDVLQSQDKRLVLTGTDILILFVYQDPNLLRTYVIQHKSNSLLGLLIKGMITDFGEDMHCQFLEIIRILLDSYTLSGSQRYTVIDIFYESYFDQLIDAIALSCPPNIIAQTIDKPAGFGGRVESQAVTRPEILSSICELLCFCVLHHPYRIKHNFLINNVIEKVLFLTRRREKYLVVAAIRFVRTIISRNHDEHLLRHIIKNNLLKPIVDAFVGNGNRYNLLYSAVLEIFEFIRKENLRTLIVYIVNNFWDQLVKFEHLGTIRALKVRYEQSIKNCETRRTDNMGVPRKQNDARALEKEEDYFNVDSDEEVSESARASNTRNEPAQPIMPNGTRIRYLSFRPVSGGLVHYEDDDEEDYDPSLGSKQEIAVGGATTVDSLKLKRRSVSAAANCNAEELELLKKQRPDRNPNTGTCAAAAACSTCTSGNSTSKKTTMPPVSDEPNCKKEPTIPRGCSNCLPNADDTRQSSGKDCPMIPATDSMSEIATNGTNVNGSEPYSVR